jgi:hypothetical protein
VLANASSCVKFWQPEVLRPTLRSCLALPPVSGRLLGAFAHAARLWRCWTEVRRVRHARVLSLCTAHHRPPKLHTLHISHRWCRQGYQELIRGSQCSRGVRSPARCNHATPRRRRELKYSGATECMCHQWAQVRTGAGARPGIIPVREGASRDIADFRKHPPNPCNEGAAHQPPPKTRTPAAHALTERDRERHSPGGPLQEGPWRVPGGERGQTWACQAAGWHPTAPAAAGAPALGRHGRIGAPTAGSQNRVRRTGRGRTRAGGALPPCATLRRAPSEPLQSRCPPRVRIALGARAAPLDARECRPPPQRGRGGTWGWIRGQKGDLDRRPPLVTG